MKTSGILKVLLSSALGAIFGAFALFALNANGNNQALGVIAMIGLTTAGMAAGLIWSRDERLAYAAEMKRQNLPPKGAGASTAFLTVLALGGLALAIYLDYRTGSDALAVAIVLLLAVTLVTVYLRQRWRLRVVSAIGPFLPSALIVLGSVNAWIGLRQSDPLLHATSLVASAFVIEVGLVQLILPRLVAR